MFGKALEDASLTVLLVFAACAAARAVDTGKLGHLLLSGTWIGLAFQAKMLQSWAVVPAFGLVYLIAAPGAISRRIPHVLAAGALTVAVSFSWMILTTVTPAHDRPYIDGSTNNNAFAMVIGYNGLARFSQVGLSAAGTGSVTATQGGFGGRPNPAAGTATTRAGATGTHGHDQTATGKHPGTSTARAGATATATAAGKGAANAVPALRHTDSGTTGWTKLIGSPLASQIGWLYPLAALGAITGIWWRRGRRRTDPVRAGYLLWAGWVATTGLGLSAGSVAHSTYVVALAPALAALAGAALSSYLAEWRTPTTRARIWALPAALGLTAAWSWHVSAHYPAFLPWLIPATLTATALAAAALAWHNLDTALPPRTPAELPALALAASLLALLAPAAAWTLSVFDSAYDGSSANASAGPYSGGFIFTVPAATAHTTARRMNPFNPSPVLDPAQKDLIAYLTAHRSGSKYLLATESWSMAAPYIMDDAASVLPMGGFSGSADFPTLSQFDHLVSTDSDQYVLLNGSGRMNRGGPDLKSIAASVTRTCSLVPPASYGGVTGETAPLYHC